MAANNSNFVTFLHATETAFYFEELDKDGFLYKSDFQKWIKSKDNKFLILNESAEFQCQNLSIQEQEYYPENKLHVCVYKNSDKMGKMGVILYTCKDQKKVVLCCSDKLEIHPVEMDISHDIAEKAHKALFYLERITEGCYLLESSLYPSMFLAFEPDSNNQTLNKVILRHKEYDDVDETCHVIMS
ncbi:interleukin-18 [Takifugu rubripes]|uniref:Interleukin-18 n=1 Tax=Takifugu rubripes TaxID=31033 RepID=Q70T31_TAKRU|nr:interleukin-18 [Takifugu rubripes]CAD70075.1 interleukin-18 [Takifugu rubripes]CAD70076.1 interleukin-18 [Takifugu rubripes]|eukprot:NP_001027804.1 interleukin-18 [Takifugu rubripes]